MRISPRSLPAAAGAAVSVGVFRYDAAARGQDRGDGGDFAAEEEHFPCLAARGASRRRELCNSFFFTQRAIFDNYGAEMSAVACLAATRQHSRWTQQSRRVPGKLAAGNAAAL